MFGIFSSLLVTLGDNSVMCIRQTSLTGLPCVYIWTNTYTSNIPVEHRGCQLKVAPHREQTCPHETCMSPTCASLIPVMSDGFGIRKMCSLQIEKRRTILTFEYAMGG